MRKVYVISKPNLYTKNFLNQLYELIPQDNVKISSGIEQLINLYQIKDDDLIVIDRALQDSLGINIENLISTIRKLNSKVAIIVLMLMPDDALIQRLSGFSNVYFLRKLDDNRKLLKSILKVNSGEMNFDTNFAPKKDKKRILVIDDFKNTRYIVKLSLEKEGFVVDTASDGIDALKKIEQNPDFDLFIVDINMPKMDGITFIEKIRNKDKFKDKPIIILTTDVDKKIKNKAKQLKVTGWIQKPYNLNEFVETIKRALNI